MINVWIRTSKMPPSCATRNSRSIDRTPNIKILPFTIKYAVRSVGLPLKQPRQMSSSSTPAVEFNTTDKELQEYSSIIPKWNARKKKKTFPTLKLHQIYRQQINQEFHDIFQSFASHKSETIDRPLWLIQMFLDHNPKNVHRREHHHNSTPTQTESHQL